MTRTTPTFLFLFVVRLIQVGNNITGDARKLHKDFPELEGKVANFCELTSLTPQPQARCSLGELVTRTSGKEMDKDLGEGARADWTAYPLSRNQLLYAATDAYAGHLVWTVLEKQKASMLGSLGQKEPARSRRREGATQAGAGAGAGEHGVGANGNDGPSEARLGDDRLGGRTGGVLDLSSDVLDEIEAGVSAAAWLTGGDGDGDDDGDDNDRVEEVEVLPDDDSSHRSDPEVCHC